MATSKGWLRMCRWAVMLCFALAAALAAGQQSEARPVDGYDGPRAIFAPDPDYTAEAAQKHIRGEVNLAIEVLPDGRTNNIRVTKSLDPSLDQSAVEAVAHWRFQPSTKNGTPVSAKVNIVLWFSWPNPGFFPNPPYVLSGLPCLKRINSHDIKKLLKEASDGDPNAQLAIGCTYEYGIPGVIKDRAQAINWYGKAAETLVPAQYFLGETYLRNFDFVQAYTWLSIADSGGYKDPSGTLKVVTTLLTAEELSEAQAKVAEWKRQHGPR
jgi:TonB family protein